jgi:uncharacterized protein (TIGR02271 family)
MTHTIVGIFDDRTEAQSAMEDLVEAGFMKEHIDISNRRSGDTNFGTETGRTSGTNMGTAGTGTAPDYDRGDESIGDKVSNFFSSIFGDSPEAEKYTTAASDADAILTVQTDSMERAEKAREILDDNGAIDVDDRSADFQGGYTGSTGTDTQINQGDVDQGRVNIPVMEEDLDVGKRQVERGGVRVRSRIVEKPVEETVRLREEHVTVNRQPVDRPVDPGELTNFKEGEYDITERAEQPVVSKNARVTENVSIDKNVEEHDEVVRDKVRKTEVDVDKLNDENTRSRGANR